MRNLIEIVNQLQDVCSASSCEGVDLPQIVVVGTQSAGKSSVLEHIVGQSFLPRGVGVVTRRPLVLQLTHEPTTGTPDYAVFNHKPDEVFHDYESITRELEAETNRLAGTNKGIHKDPIHLKIFSNSFVSLTLIDLPGVTKVPVGSQPHDIENQVRDLILTYISKPNCLILAVSPANTDFTTSESLKLAAEVDPHCDRTLAVLTKLDLMDQGTDAMDVLRGKVIPIKLGIVGVVNRSQLDIQQGKSVADSLKDEQEFLTRRYPQIASSHGSKYLTNKIQNLLIEHIRKCLPELRRDIDEKLKETRSELFRYEEKKSDKYSMLQDLICSFTRSYNAVIRGKLIKIDTDEIYGGARIYNVYNIFSETINSNQMGPLYEMEESHIIAAIQNASGHKPAVFVPEVAFESLSKIEIEKFLLPSLICVDSIYDELRIILQSCIEDDSLGLKRYPILKTELEKHVSTILDERSSKAKDSVREFINIQKSYIKTNNPEFLVKPEVDLPSTGISCGSKPKFNLDLIKAMVKIYYDIVRKIVVDTIPKMAKHYMVNFVMDQLQTELVKSFSTKVEDLMSESQSVIEKRGTLKKKIEDLARMQQILYKMSSTVTTNNL